MFSTPRRRSYYLYSYYLFLLLVGLGERSKFLALSLGERSKFLALSLGERSWKTPQNHSELWIRPSRGL